MTRASYVRRLETDDAPAVAALRLEALELHPLAFGASIPENSAELIDSYRSSLATGAESALFGAFVGDALVGMVAVRRRSGKESHKATITGMYVRSENRRSGTGQSLLRAAIEHVRSWRGVHQLHLSVTEVAGNAKRLYERNGFRDWGREPRARCWQGQYVEESHMVLDLEDVPGRVDFRNEPEARAWIEQTAQKRPYRTTFFNKFADELKVLGESPLKVLELGSGPGMLAEQILRRCPSVDPYTLLDFSEPMLFMSRERLAEFNARLRFVCVDFRSTDWTVKVGGPFDVVLSMQAVHEVRHKRHVTTLYEKVASVLTRCGVVLICDHLPGDNPDARRDALYMTPEEQLAAFETAGFRNASVRFVANEMALYSAWLSNG